MPQQPSSVRQNENPNYPQGTTQNPQPLSPPISFNTEADPSELPSVFNFFLVLSVLRRRLWILLALTTAFGFFVYRWSSSRPKKYQASTVIEVVANSPKLFTNIRDVINHNFQTRRFYATQEALLKSEEVAQRALNSRPWILQSPSFFGLDKIKDPVKRAAKMNKMRTKAASFLLTKVTIRPIKKSRLFEIIVQDTDPKRAQELSLAIAEAYQEYNRDFRLRTTLNAYKEVKKRLIDYRLQAKNLHKKIMEFRQRHGVLTTSLDDRRNLAFKQLEQLNARQIQVTLRKIQLESRLKPLLKHKVINPFHESFSPILDNQFIEKLKQQYSLLILKRQSLMSLYKPKHRKVRRIDSQIREIKKLLREQANLILASYKEKLASVKREERTLRRKIRSTKRKLQRLDKLNLNFDQLQRKQRALNQSLKFLNRRYFELQLLKDSITTNVRIVQRPQRPDKPYSPRPKRMTFIGVVFAFAGFFFIFLTIELLDNSIYTLEDIEVKSKLPPLGEVPLIDFKKLRAQLGMPSDVEPLYNPDRPLTELEEAIRTLRTNLLFTMNAGNHKTMLITSPSPREGKTFLAGNLAISLAHVGKKTILVDTDMRRPRIHKLMRLENYDRSKGSSSVIIGQHTLDEAIIKDTPYENLHILPCGPIPPSPTELIETEGFLKMLRELEERYDVILFDSPPTLSVADTAVLSNYVGGVILVATSGKTKWNALYTTARKIEAVGGNIFGAILNKYDPKHQKSYSYSYKYRYYKANYRYKPEEETSSSWFSRKKSS